MDSDGHGAGLAPVQSEPPLPPDALAALERSMTAGGGRGPGSLARRLGTLTSLLVLGVAAAAGFIGGVQVQKRQGETTAVSAAGAGARAGGSSSTTVAGGPGPAGGPSSTFAAGAGGAGAARGAGAGGGGGAARGGGAGGAGPAAAGQVKLVDGNNLYVTDAQGNVVKVVTTPASRFTRTGTGSIQDVRPGDTVVVQGQKGDDGIVTATVVADSGTPGGP